MAELKISTTELVSLIKQNFDFPNEVTKIYADGNGITAKLAIPIAGERSYFITYQSFSNDILTCRINGNGLFDKVLLGLFSSIVAMIKSFTGNERLGKFIRVSGDTILIHLNDLFKKINGVIVDQIIVESGNITVNINVPNVYENLETFKLVEPGKAVI